MALHTIHLAFKTHLDLGFTDFAEAVLNRYLEEHLPNAMSTARRLRADGVPFSWTIGSFVLNEALERADRDMRAELEEAIEAGDLHWHALPFTLHTELADVALIEHGLSISARLDERFGRRTTAAKMTDVPGHTRGLVPLLAEAGVEFLHLGVNPASTPPEVPSLFRWQAAGTEVIVAFDGASYGGLVEAPGTGEALAVTLTGDNVGPPDEAMVLLTAARYEGDHPGVELRVGGLDAIVGPLRQARSQLPVVTGELGDSWIHGVASDPVKVARLRELMRVRRTWAPGAIPDGFSTSLLCVTEHTWGMDHKLHLPEWSLWSRSSLAGIRDEPLVQRFESSWSEQRAYLDAALDALPGPLRAEAEAALAAIEPEVPVVEKPESVPFGDVVTLGPWRLRVDPYRLAIDHLELTTSAGPVTLADERSRLAEYSYQAFDSADYARFSAAYNRINAETIDWALFDFTKPGIDTDGAVSERWWAHVVNMVVGVSPAGAPRVVIEARTPEAARDVMGAPECVWMVVDASERSGRPVLALDLVWLNKPATRLPEAGWWGFRPCVDAPDLWRFDKLGYPLDVADCLPRGGSRLHAVGEGARHPAMRFRTLDAPLIAVGEPTLLDPAPFLADAAAADTSRGLHLCLHNNVWGTNFPMWCEGPARFRVEIEPEPLRQ